jgi:bla regulator protein blaR1
MIGHLINHLWQSTAFAAAAALLTLAFRLNRAQVRYAIWFTASLKFLMPFALLMAVGSQFHHEAKPMPVSAQVTRAVELVTTPFPITRNAEPRQTPQSDWMSIAVLAVWGCGFAGIAIYRVRSWRRLRLAVQSSALAGIAAPIQVRVSKELFEPGVFGWRDPVLIVPEGLLETLSADQFHAVLAHEICHLKRCDNLTALIHMIIEALFWFHPMVWWIGARLVEERELACDEVVLAQGADPKSYARLILQICKQYVQSPLACAPGIAGSGIARRIEVIMKNRVSRKLRAGRKLALTAIALIAIGAPIVIGTLNVTPLLRAQSTGKYDIVSIKPHPQGDRGGALPQFLQGGEFKSANVPLLVVIAFAWNVPFQGEQITGGPTWLHSPDSIFDIDAKSDTDVTKGLSPRERDEKLRGMLQAVLTDYFKLRARREMQDQPVYLLTVAKNGPKLQQSKLQPKDCDEDPSQCHTGGAGQGRGIHSKAATIQQIVVDVSNYTDHPLLDRTGVKGLYDIDTDGWVPMRPRAPRPPGTEPAAEDLAFADPARPTLYQIFDRLGLKMESSRAAADVIIIESIEKPAAN